MLFFLPPRAHSSGRLTHKLVFLPSDCLRPFTYRYPAALSAQALLLPSMLLWNALYLERGTKTISVVFFQAWGPPDNPCDLGLPLPDRGHREGTDLWLGHLERHTSESLARSCQLVFRGGKPQRATACHNIPQIITDRHRSPHCATNGHSQTEPDQANDVGGA